MDFVFFGGDQGKIKILNFSTGELFPGSLETSIEWICSLQVCVKSLSKIFLAVSGSLPNYDDDKTNLFNVSELFLNNPVNLKKLYSEYPIDQIKNILPQQITIKFMKGTIQKLTHQRDFYKSKSNKIETKYDELIKQKKKLKKAFEKLNTPFKFKYKQFSRKINILYQHKKKRIIMRAFGHLNENGLSDETDPLLIMINFMKELKEKNNMIKNYENTNYDIMGRSKAAEEEAERLRVHLHAAETKKLQIEQIVLQR